MSGEPICRFAAPHSADERIVAAVAAGDLLALESEFASTFGEWVHDPEDTILGRALELALIAENAAIVRFLWGQGVTSCQKWIESPLGAACSGGSIAMVRLLLELGADPNARTQPLDGWTIRPLIKALKACDNAALKLLLESGADPNFVCEDFSFDIGANERCTPLLIAEVSCNRPAQRLLLAHGADPKLAQRLGLTARTFQPLDRVRARYLDPVRKLVFLTEREQILAGCFERHLARVPDLDVHDGALLASATRRRRRDLLEILFAHGANPNRCLRWTLAELDGGGGEFARLFLAAGYNVNAQDNGNPLREACRRNAMSVIDALLRAGAYPDGHNLNAEHAEFTPLIEATWRGNIEAVRLLLENGADPNLSSGGFAPFDYYAEDGERFRRWIVEFERPFEVSTQNHLTPLMVAVATGETSIAELLLRERAQVDNYDAFGRTAADYAQLCRSEQRRAAARKIVKW